MKTENIEDIYELSAIQQGILFHCIYAPDSGFYFVQKRFTLRGNLNFVAFDRAWQEVVAKHTSLRTGFYWEDINKPLQVVYKQVKVPLEQQDWRGIEPGVQQKRLESFLESDRKQGFDLSQDCLMRLTLIHLTDHSYELVWSANFIIMDGWSVMLVLNDVFQLYEVFCQGEDVSSTLGSSFGDYIAWLQQQDLSKAEMFWRQALQGLKAPTPLTNLYVDNLSSQQERYDYQRNSLSQATTAALQAFARQHQLTLNTIIQGAWAFLLSRYSGENKVVYGCTVAGRPVDLVGADSMVGTLINTLPVWIDVDDEQSLLVWLRQLQKQLVEMRQYEYSPLVEIQGWSEMPRGVPLFDSIVVFEKVPLLSVLKSRQGELEIEMTHIWYKTNYPLNVVVYPMSELTIEIAYDCCRFEESAIATILTHFEILLQGMLTNPNLQLKDLQLLTASQQRITSMLENEVTFDFAACH
jgi:hypothetical protein